jgi:arylsulfatase A-like enzyme
VPAVPIPVLAELALAGLLLTGAVVERPDATSDDDRPDVLVIVIDDAGFEDYAAAPADDIVALAGAGRVYTRFYVSPLCSPSRYQLHFGRYPHRRLIGAALSPPAGAGAPTEDLSIAERLNAEGYATGLFGKWHVSGKKQPIQIFEAARVHGYQTWRAGSAGNIVKGGDHYNWERIDDGERVIETRYSTLAINEALEEWWSATEGPRFAVCSYLAPHDPFQLPPAELVPGVPPAGASLRATYEYALAGVDNAVARLARTLDLSNAYVFLLPDNGTPQNAQPVPPQSPGYKLSPFEGGIHVPLVVWGPGVEPGVDDALTQVVDLPATILELVGAPPMAEPADSISFAPTLTGGPGARRAVLSQRFKPNGGPFEALDLHSWAVVRADGMKLLVDDAPFAPPGAGEPGLYDLARDPWEQVPLTDPALAAELEALRQELLGPDWPYPF